MDIETLGEVTVRRWAKAWKGDQNIEDAFTNVHPDHPLFNFSCDVSEIPDPFEEVNRGENVQKKILKSDVRLAADQEFMAQFSDDYKSATSMVRKEMGLGENMLLEDPEYIRSNAATYEEVKKTPKEIVELAEEIMKDVDVDITLKLQKEDSKKVVEKVDTDVYDNRSAIWRMLGAHENFKVTTPGFDVFHGSEPHWLQQDEVPLATREEARSKCLTWLQKVEPPAALKKQHGVKNRTSAMSKLRIDRLVKK